MTIRTITNTSPATPAELANTETAENEVYIEFTEVDGYGIRSIRGPVAYVSENDDRDEHVATVTVKDPDTGTVDFILVTDDDGEVVLDGGLEAKTHAEGYTVFDVESVETLEISDYEYGRLSTEAGDEP